MKLSEIDVNFNFIEDTPGYWDGFWENDTLLGRSKQDPDSKSPMLRKYHQLLWSKMLPNGEVMKLEDGKSSFYLGWKNHYFGSDSIIVSFRYKRRAEFMKKLRNYLPDYKGFVESYLKSASSIGSYILFPSFGCGMNQSRGTSKTVCDRWDLTLECIRRYYAGEWSPLEKCMNEPRNRWFFDLFMDFKGYVDFFFLQDCVSEDYSSVNIWYRPTEQSGSLFDNAGAAGDTGYDFSVKDHMPDTIDSYLAFIEKELDFMRKRNQRIKEYCLDIKE